MGERGSVLPAVFVLAFAGLLLLGLAVDLGRWGATWREAAFAADAGAEAGAAMIDPAAAYRGELLLDPVLAEDVAADAALRARPRPDRTVTAAGTPAEVCVTVSQPFRPTLLRAAGIGPVEVTADACARPAQG
jgi:hypothetical protein